MKKFKVGEYVECTRFIWGPIREEDGRQHGISEGDGHIRQVVKAGPAYNNAYGENDFYCKTIAVKKSDGDYIMCPHDIDPPADLHWINYKNLRLFSELELMSILGTVEDSELSK